MELETFEGWTIDQKLKQLRKIDANDKILFIDFDSELGDLIFQKKLILKEINNLRFELAEAHEENWKEDLILDIVSDIESANAYLDRVTEVINKLESENR